MNLEVRKIMTTNPIVAHPDQTIAEVTALMMDSAMQQLPVVDHGKLVGMLTSYDLWKSGISQGTGHLKVKDVMTTKVIRLTPKDKVGTAAELFADKRFKTLPIVNLDGELKGVITAFDVIKCVFKEEYPRPILYQEAFV